MANDTQVSNVAPGPFFFYILEAEKDLLVQDILKTPQLKLRMQRSTRSSCLYGLFASIAHY